MRKALAASCFGLAILVATLGPASAEKRVALVIGNAAYEHAPRLANPGNDAGDMAAKLRNLGFEVVDGIDLAKRDMEKRIRAFADVLAGADVGLFYYAGHGLQVDNKNFLAPVDAELKAESDLDFEAVELDLVLKHMIRNTPTSIVFLDACRDNPLAANLARVSRSLDIGRGLADVETPASMMIVFATEPKNVALDGTGRNSPFTAALLRHIDAEGVSISDMMIEVRKDVLAATGGKQRPFESASLTGKFFFKPRPEVPSPSPSEEIAALRAEIARLQSDQGALLKSQQEQLERLQAKLANETAEGTTPPSPTPTSPAASPEAPQVAAPSPADATKTAAVESKTPEPDASTPSTSPLPQSRSPEAITKDMLAELKRLNCYFGTIKGTWGTRTKSAVERFNTVSSLELPLDAPQEASLNALKGWNGPNCPVEKAATPREKSRPTAAAPKKQVAPAPRKAAKAPARPRSQAASPRRGPEGSGSAEINELQRLFPEGAWIKPR
jgi:uncharacterized caspase-like protein